MSEDWLSALKAGDEVAIRSGFGIDNYRIDRVQRVTPSKVVVNGNKFRKADGRRVGEDRFNRHILVSPTTKIREQIAREEAISELRFTDWRRYPTPMLLEVAAMKAKAEAALREEGSDHP